MFMLRTLNPVRGCGLQLMQRVAFSSFKIKCAEDTAPPCSPANTAKKIASGVCDPAKERAVRLSPRFNEECCNNPCIDMYPRFDDLYYKPSDKRLRKYAQTWVECPKEQIKPKKICCFEEKEVHFERRKPWPKPKRISSCPISKKASRLGLMDCGKTSHVRRLCPRIMLPGCKNMRDPPHCLKLRGASKCKKVCTPYPAYSECNRDDPKPRRPTECRCLEVGVICHPLSPIPKRQGQ